MATTEEALFDRITSVCVTAGYTRAVSMDFKQQPDSKIDGVFALKLEADRPVGGFNFSEDCRATAQIDLARLMNDDYHAARKTLLADARTLIAAIVRDGAQASGEYAVEDVGRTVILEAPPGASYLVARARVPLNFEAVL